MPSTWQCVMVRFSRSRRGMGQQQKGGEVLFHNATEGIISLACAKSVQVGWVYLWHVSKGGWCGHSSSAS